MDFLQVEAVLLAHPAIVQAAAFGIANHVMGEMVHAAVTLAPGSLVRLLFSSCETPEWDADA